MKTKQEILEQIKRIRTSINKYKILPKSQRQHYEDIAQGQIRALKWVLGHKIKTYYFCSNCQIPHIGIKCPKCGNDVVRL